MLVLNIGASLLAFYAFVTFLDQAVNWFGCFAGSPEVTFTYLLGYVLYPIAFLIGIESTVSSLKLHFGNIERLHIIC